VGSSGTRREFCTDEPICGRLLTEIAILAAQGLRHVDHTTPGLLEVTWTGSETLITVGSTLWIAAAWQRLISSWTIRANVGTPSRRPL
jgi:hypothetical protein